MKALCSGIARLLAAGVLVVAFAVPVSAADTAMVRVLHASPDAPAVDVQLDDAPVSALTGVPFGTISDYLEVPAGDHNVKVFATGTTTDPVIDADVTVAAGAAYTIAATDALASITPQVLQDEPSPSCDNAQVRVVHFSADAPAVDVAAAGTSPDEAIVQDLAYPDASDYLDIPGGTYDLEVRVAGETTVALDLPGVAVEDCMSYSVFAIGSAASPAVGDNALQVVVAVDGTASPDGTRVADMPAPPETDTLGSDQAAPATGLPLGLLAVAGSGIPREPARARCSTGRGRGSASPGMIETRDRRRSSTPVPPRSSGSIAMLTMLIDDLLELSIVGSFSRIGSTVRRRLFDWSDPPRRRHARTDRPRDRPDVRTWACDGRTPGRPRCPRRPRRA